MSNSSLARRIRANRRSRSPVQDTVNEQFDDISDAIMSGSSFRDIHAQLTREGHNVGKGHNSLFAAYRAVQIRRAQVPPTSLVGAPPAVPTISAAALQTLPASSGEMPSVVVDSRRNTTDW